MDSFGIKIFKINSLYNINVPNSNKIIKLFQIFKLSKLLKINY